MPLIANNKPGELFTMKTHVCALLKLSNGFTENISEKTLNEKGIALTIIINDVAWRNVEGLVLVGAWLNERGCWL